MSETVPGFGASMGVDEDVRKVVKGVINESVPPELQKDVWLATETVLQKAKRRPFAALRCSCPWLLRRCVAEELNANVFSVINRLVATIQGYAKSGFPALMPAGQPLHRKWLTLRLNQRAKRHHLSNGILRLI